MTGPDSADSRTTGRVETVPGSAARNASARHLVGSGMTDNIAVSSGTFDIGGDLPVVRLGYGTMQLPGKGVWGPAKDHDTAMAVLRRSVELGITFFDTADSYGPETAEQLLKDALHPYADDVVIATKAGLTRQGPGVWTPLGYPPYLRQQCELSLRRLGVETIDLFQLHRIDAAYPLEDQVGEFKALQDEGKIRHIGLSEVTVDQIKAAREIAEITHRAEPLQPRQPQRRGRPGLLRGGGHRLHPVVPARDRCAVQGGRPARRCRQAPRRDAVPARARLAAAAVAGDAADPGHLERRPPRVQHRRCWRSS